MKNRVLAGAIALAGAAACGAAPAREPAERAASPAPSRPARPKPVARTPRVEPAAVSVPAVTLSPHEPEPAAKRLASVVAVELTTYGAGDTAASVAARVTDDVERRRLLAAAAGPLVEAGRRSRGEVVYPQLGGLTATRASVMVVVRQEVAGRGPVTRVLDVRLVRVAGRWAFDSLASAGGTPVPRPPTLSDAARAVLDHPRIALPDSARWDVHAGRVDDALLRLMAEIADRTPYAVTVLESGHPHDVFGTHRASAHTLGRAVDIRALDGAPVCDQRRRGTAAYDLTRWLLARGDVRQVGSPWDLDARGARRSFTNVVHHDHLHVAT